MMGMEKIVNILPMHLPVPVNIIQMIVRSMNHPHRKVQKRNQQEFGGKQSE